MTRQCLLRAVKPGKLKDNDAAWESRNLTLQQEMAVGGFNCTLCRTHKPDALVSKPLKLAGAFKFCDPAVYYSFSSTHLLPTWLLSVFRLSLLAHTSASCKRA